MKRIDAVTDASIGKTGDGTEESFQFSPDAGKDVGEVVEKSGEVIVFYREEAGHKVAHFFQTVLKIQSLTGDYPEIEALTTVSQVWLSPFHRDILNMPLKVKP